MTPAALTSGTPAFIGWHRAGSRYPWEAVCQAPTDMKAWDLLLSGWRGGDKCVLPSGRRPDDPKRRPQQQRRA